MQGKNWIGAVLFVAYQVVSTLGLFIWYAKKHPTEAMGYWTAVRKFFSRQA